MTLYAVVLFTHSYLRWVILLAMGLVLFRTFRGWRQGSAWTPIDERAHAALVGLTDLQFLLGVVLYVWLSPMTTAFFADARAGMKVSALRFFALEHVTLMLVAVALLHVGRTRSKKAPDAKLRHRRAWSFTLASLVFMFAAIPWPFYKASRPLLRGAEASAETAAPSAGANADAVCPDVYRSRCAACHGEQGRGDGLAARSLVNPPRDFADSDWARKRSDGELFAIIHDGGLAHGLSASMPPHSDLPKAQIDALVACVRALGARAETAP